MRVRVFLDWLLPVLLLVALTVPFWTTGLDVVVESRYYVPGAGWPLGSTQPWHALKHFGVIPAWLIGAGALAVFTASFWNQRLRPKRRATLFLVLALAVGPGLVVNDVFKKHWGRPRPLDVRELGGDRAYAAPWVKQPAEMGGSFASGHAAMGFFLLVPYFLLRQRRRGAAILVLAAGIVYGCLVGYARMVQGAHFPSDVLWALGFVYLTALSLFYAMGLAAREGPG